MQMSFGLGGISLSGWEEGGEAFTTIAAQLPQKVAGFQSRVDRTVLERFHLDRYASDDLLSRGSPPFESIRTGADPPDFVVTAEGADHKLDCVQFAFESWRAGERLFARFLERLNESASDYDFSGLAGTVVSIGFGHLDELPPRRGDDALVEPLLALMGGATVDHQAAAALAAEIQQSGFPEQFPPRTIATGRTEDESAMFVANIVADPAGGQVPLDRPVSVDLQLAEHLTVSQLVDRLQALTKDHDKPEIDWLLVTAGGPDRDGLRYPGEEMAASFLLDHAVPPIATEHISRVVVHLWEGAQCREIEVRA
jgi:hypothetical protein